MRVHLINPSDLSFGLAVITPRWLFVLAAATPERFGTPVLVDETLERLDPATLVGSQKDRTPVSQNLSPSSSLLPDRASACPNRWPSV
jgi:hypothetical protein